MAKPIPSMDEVTIQVEANIPPPLTEEQFSERVHDMLAEIIENLKKGQHIPAYTPVCIPIFWKEEEAAKAFLEHIQGFKDELDSLKWIISEEGIFAPPPPPPLPKKKGKNRQPQPPQGPQPTKVLFFFLWPRVK